MKLPEIWLGKESAHHQYLNSASYFYENPDKFQGQIEAIRTSLYEEDEEYSLAERHAMDMIMYHGNVGILSVSGPMSRETSFFSMISGGVGYDAIGEALSMLAEDEEVASILLAVDTPGGDANGIYELSEVIKQVDQSKPVVAWASGGALSAGYWLATSAREFYTSKMAEIGSIGAISSFTSVARMMEKEGIDVHVSRSGKYKALLNPMEPISEEGKRDLQARTEYLHQVFADSVVANRPSLAGKDRQTWAEGQTFFADKAIEMGLVSGPPLSLTEILGTLETRIEGDTMKRQQIILSESARAALLSGADLKQVEHEVKNVEDEHDLQLAEDGGYKPTSEMAAEAKRGLEWRQEYGRGGTEVGVARARDISNRKNLSADTVKRMVSYFARHEVDKEGEGWSQDEDGYPSAGRIAWALWGGDPGKSWANKIADQLDNEDEAQASDVSTELSEAKPAEKTDAGFTSYLQAQLDKRDERIESLLLDQAETKQKLSSLKAVEELLKPIAIEACQRMQVALGQPAGKLEGLSATAVADQHAALLSDFNERFRVGQLSENRQETSQEIRNPLQERLALVQGGKK